MKYYFPTSTLNFDAIYSSMSLMPPAYYRDEAIWFPRYFKTSVDVSDDMIVLYSSPIKWDIPDEGMDNYPMLVEIDSEIVDFLSHDSVHVVRTELENSGIFCVMSNMPIVFKVADMLSGKVRILFRNQYERKSRETRAMVGVAECKFAGAFKGLRIDICTDSFPSNVITFDLIKAKVLNVVSNYELRFSRNDFEEFERKDRQSGAETGFLAGKWIRSMRDGYCLDSFKGGLDYDSWKKSLPIEFSNIIDMLCNKIGFRWDVNRSAIVDFCAECWKCCFNVGENTPAIEQWHTILQDIARSHKDPTSNCPVSSINDCYMQALACFIGAGKRSNLLAKSIRDDNVVLPELALALYGALVGYSVFSRIFFERRNFEPPPPPPPRPPLPPLPPKMPPPTVSLPDWARRIIDVARKVFSGLGIPHKKRSVLDSTLLQSLSECTNERELIQQLPTKHQKEGWGARTNVFKKLKEEIQYGGNTLVVQHLNEDDTQCSTTMETERGCELLIDDCNLVNSVRNFLLAQAGFDERERMRILEAVRYLQREYSPGGRYSKDETKNPRDNANTIRHLVNLINKNVLLSEATKDSLYSFLKQRYS